MKLTFKKMHGIGNDFVFFDMREQIMPLEESQIQNICNRHTGVGCDQLIVMHQSNVADCKLKIYNANGKEASACGNATRCAVKIICNNNKTNKASIEVGKRVINGEQSATGITINMGKPLYNWEAIPLKEEINTLNIKLPIQNKNIIKAACVNVGNPHLVLICTDLAKINCAEIGMQLENHLLFPEGINVNFAEVMNPTLIKLKVWERGTGLTKACGTGATATFAICHNFGLVKRTATVELEGGSLKLSLNTNDEIIMEGEAQESFTGEVAL